MVQIERLTLAMRNMVGLNKRDARFLHIAPADHINTPVKAGRYNVRQKDGSIQKYTLFDNEIVIDVIKKISNKYEKVSRNVVNVFK